MELMTNQNHYHFKKTLLLFFVVVLITIVIYSPGLRGPFVYDDLPQIVSNQKLHDLREIKDVLFNGSRQIRVLQNISFAMNWTVSPNKSVSFKITNIFLHLTNGFLLFLLLRHVFPRRSFITFFSVFLFLTHPLQVQSVAYVMGRISLIQTFFYLLLLIMISGRWHEQPVLIVGLLVLSYIAKESCLLLPLILLVYKISINGDNFRSLNCKNVMSYFFTILLFIPIYIIFKDPSSMYRGTVGFDLYPYWEYIIMQMYYYLFYLFLFFNSSYQSIIHPFLGISTTTAVLGILGGTAYLVVFIWAISNLRRRPELSFFILFFFITL